MTATPTISPEAIRAYRSENSKLRERDIAANLKISEAALVAAETGLGVTRIDADPNRMLAHAKALGEVMVLTRNENVVHEKIGEFETIQTGQHVAMTLGENIDLRIFPKVWAHGFAVRKMSEGIERLSLQYFDKAGDAVFKLHLRDTSNREAYHALVAELALEDQSQSFTPDTSGLADEGAEEVDAAELRAAWSAMTDPHQFFGMLKKLKIRRRAAVRHVGEDYAWPLEAGAVATLLSAIAEADLDIMCFVGSRGTVQIHSGKIKQIKEMGPWLNVMDPTFHMHLRHDRIAEIWAVRKPADTGHVTSIEAYDKDGEMIVQFFGKRKEGKAELAGWRALVESLPRARASAAA